MSRRASGLLTPRGDPTPFRRVVLVSDGANPSFDYYLAPRLARGPEIVEAGLRDARSLPPGSLDGALLIFCRYLTGDWLARMRTEQAAGAALFIDDDFLALAGDRSVPLRYRYKLWRCGFAHWSRLAPMLVRLHVSTRELGARYGGGRATLLPPVAGPEDLGPPPARPSPPLICFHATAAHRREREWLTPVLRAVLSADARTTIEVVADHATARLWRGDPRVAVVPQEGWPEYRRRTAGRGADLFLAPLLPSPANLARAPTKRIDAARSGAALLVSDPDLYGVTPAETALGMAVKLDPEEWTRAIVSIAADRRRLEELARLNREQLEAAARNVASLWNAAPDGDFVLS